MSIKPVLAFGLQECVGKQSEHDDFSDFIVTVEGKSFHCHRFILSACSGFFQGLLRSGMQESLSQSVDVKGVSAETFDAILKSLYKGVDQISSERVIDIWHATVQLQISYMIFECEKFVMDTLSCENYLDFYHHATILNSDKVIKNIHAFIIQNFEDFRTTETFLELPFEILHMLIDSQKLNVTSEDSVIEAILSWTAFTRGRRHDSNQAKVDTKDDESKSSVTNTPPDTGSNVVEDQETKTKEAKMVQSDGNINYGNVSVSVDSSSEIEQCVDKTKAGLRGGFGRETSGLLRCEPSPQCRQKEDNRTRHLAKLLATARIYLASSSCLETLMKHEMIQESKEALNIVIGAVMYQWRLECRHGHWPRGAIHRSSSPMENVVLFIGSDKLQAFRFGEEGTVVISLYGMAEGVPCRSIAVYGTNVYSERNNDPSGNDYKLMYFRDTQFIEFNGEIKYSSCGKSHLLSHGLFLYRLSTSETSLKRMKMGACECTAGLPDKLETVFTSQSNLQAAVAFRQHILVFSDMEPNVKMAVHCFEPETKNISWSGTLDGPANDLTGFTDEDNFYILQRNGSLWQIYGTQSNTVKFNFCGKLWDFDWEIYGAVLFLGKLFVFGNVEYNKPEGHSWVKSVPGKFEHVKPVFLKSQTQCLPAIIPKAWLQPKKEN